MELLTTNPRLVLTVKVLEDIRFGIARDGQGLEQP
jgi:hypothetical protein